MKSLVLPFNLIELKDLPIVGGKNASLGEMYNQLRPLGVQVPDGFAITADAFRQFLDHYQLKTTLNNVLTKLDTKTYSNLSLVGTQARELVSKLPIPKFIALEIEKAYRLLCGNEKNIAVAIRSSATAEDLPSASFAGQLESFLNVRGIDDILSAVHQCFCSLYTDRVINYRHEKGFSNIDLAISVGVQKMVRSDLASSGVAFTLDTETGFENTIIINSIYGLGENIVQGRSTPDEFVVFKPHLLTKYNPVIHQKTGAKEYTMVYGTGDKMVDNLPTPLHKQKMYSLSQVEIIKLANWCQLIEKHYKKHMDIEWAKDGITGELFIIQARPETIHAGADKKTIIETYAITSKGATLVEGIAIGEKIISGKARVLESPAQASELLDGEIVVTDVTNPDWDPVMKRAGGIVTNKGGRTSHAAIVARELGAVAVVGCGNATTVINNGDTITLSCAEGKTGYVYSGKALWQVSKKNIKHLPMPAIDPMLILSDPSQAFHHAMLPNKGVGLLRLEFMILHQIKVHPLALTRFNQITEPAVKQQIEQLTAGYTNLTDYFIDTLAQGISTIAAAFHPHDVIVRMSDFKSNEYKNLLGGKQFEPNEENPMLGFRGASRYYHPMYIDGFELECKAIKKVRNDMGFTNVKIMIPFCRTIEEAYHVIATLKQFGLVQKDNGLEVYVMIEIPSNVLMAEQFAEIFDGFSIGSNDLTQLTLGLDRDSALVSGLFNEMNPAVMQLIATTIHVARRKNIKVGLCGQAPSDLPEFAKFLTEQGIDSISFTPDALLRGIENIAVAEGLLKEVSEAENKLFAKKRIEYIAPHLLPL